MTRVPICLAVLTLAVFLCGEVLFAQWYPQNSGTTKNLNAVHFVDASNGYAVGDSGIILQTSDGGTTWSKQEDVTGHTLRDIFFVNANIGWAVGGDGSDYSTEGVILHTTNGGAIWTSQAYQATLNACWFADSARGWLVGNIVGDKYIKWGHILSTEDGGTNWDTTEVGNGLNDVFFANSNVGWVVEPRVYH